MNESNLHFKLYQKAIPTRARVLTEYDYMAWHGVIQTLEGPHPFQPGDYLAKDAKGHWPIRAATIRRGYQRRGAPDAEGYTDYYSLEIRQAVQMPAPFTVGDLQGKAGDYYVKDGSGAWPVDREVFERSYVEVPDSLAERP